MQMFFLNPNLYLFDNSGFSLDWDHRLSGHWIESLDLKKTLKNTFSRAKVSLCEKDQQDSNLQIFFGHMLLNLFLWCNISSRSPSLKAKVGQNYTSLKW